MKAMFLPLKSQYFDAFKAGTKTVEYRRYCKRWDERTCQVGRAVVLSRGYGKQNRLTGVISFFEKRFLFSPEWVDCYGEGGWAACIHIALIPSGSVAPRPPHETGTVPVVHSEEAQVEADQGPPVTLRVPRRFIIE